MCDGWCGTGPPFIAPRFRGWSGTGSIHKAPPAPTGTRLSQHHRPKSTEHRTHVMSAAQPLVPPLRFSALQPSLYRGSYPREINYRFLKRLQLKTIISLTPEPITEENDKALFEFARDGSIKLVHLGCAKEGGGKRKKRDVPIDYNVVVQAIELMINVDHAPIYIHCLNGGQVSSLVIACLRKLSFWSSVSIFSEFLTYTNAINIQDRTFVEGFHAEIELPTNKVDWIWSGLSKDVVGSHPTLKFVNNMKYSV